jgi:hypothetical protein
MAEFIKKPRRSDLATQVEGDSGFAAFGKTVPTERRSAALNHIRDMGILNSEAAWECIGQMSEAITRDEPYEAMAVGMRYVDLTGVYRLMAVLCAG